MKVGEFCMKNYGVVRSDKKPNLLELTDTKVFVSDNIRQITIQDTDIDGGGGYYVEYEYNLIEYTKDEYIFMLHEEQEQQNEVLDYLLMEV